MLQEFIQSDGKKLLLNEHAIKHIVEGNFAVRPMQGQENMCVLSGGMHTYNSWIAFKNKYVGKLEHLHFFNNKEHDFWYYARELGNGVINLRLPKDLFTGKAAKITMYPDDYYKSGYLWKTLFPKDYDEKKIIEVISEALENEDIDQRQTGQIVGFVNKSEPLKTIKVVIQHRGQEIKSAFPAWTQPNTGNNGKPFSHYENIGFIIAQSTEYFDDIDKNKKRPLIKFSGKTIELEQLHLHTPEIFAKRINPKEGESPSEWNKERLKSLQELSLTEEQNDLVYAYLNDFALTKHYPEIVSGAYTYGIDQIKANLAAFNTFQIPQNFSEGLYYLFFSKQHARLITTIGNILDNMVSHTLFDLLSKKKILSTILNIVINSSIPELSYKFIEKLCRSPIRREIYSDYNLDSLSKKMLETPIDHFPDKLVMVTNPALDHEIKFDDFIEIIKETYGETYTLNFNDSELTLIFKDIIENQQEANCKNLISDSLRFFSQSDFVSLSEQIHTILLSALDFEQCEQDVLSTYSGLILRDYCRIHFAHRQRINARYLDYHDFAHEMYLPIDHNLLFGLILKHERWTNSHRLDLFTKNIMEFATYIENKDLQADIKNFMRKIGKEKAPLPERVSFAKPD